MMDVPTIVEGSDVVEGKTPFDFSAFRKPSSEGFSDFPVEILEDKSVKEAVNNTIIT